MVIRVNGWLEVLLISIWGLMVGLKGCKIA